MPIRQKIFQDQSVTLHSFYRSVHKMQAYPPVYAYIVPNMLHSSFFYHNNFCKRFN
ncbi:hypothetical protein SB48_HM08orf02740 [Heyndrickxia coagulans]|uniref:Uncharacterized protein n=1 Tax=Heyndrickxia coagulans TaxID=1398 RepID=A0AAN0T5P2_HEYCO|nr:hypothetical protein SB48_HM08orf02740 [Heyndrickxia coagulans]